MERRSRSRSPTGLEERIAALQLGTKKLDKDLKNEQVDAMLVGEEEGEDKGEAGEEGWAQEWQGGWGENWEEKVKAEWWWGYDTWWTAWGEDWWAWNWVNGEWLSWTSWTSQ
jgi:hypothetical protein